MPSEHREEHLHGLVKDLVVYGHIRTTLARAKEAQRLADRLVTLGKEGSVHSRRRAFRVLQNRTLVKQLFAEIAPRYVDLSGGYTRVTRLGLRRGDGAQTALLSLSRAPLRMPAPAPGQKPAPKPQPPSGGAPAAKAEKPEKPSAEEGEKPKSFFEGLRGLWSKKKKGSAGS
jgi:large subunit ribosomal protein L17